MLSRKTLLLSFAPSLVLLTAVGLTLRAKQILGSELLFALVAAYIAGVPIGILLARRYGKLVPPHEPFL